MGQAFKPTADGGKRGSALAEWWSTRHVPGYTRWAYIAPALAGFLFVGHAWEDAGWQGATPYALVLLVSLAQLIRPTILGWLTTATLVLAYLVLFIAEASVDRVGEWVVALLIGLIPALLLVWARPRVQQNAGPARPDADGEGMGGGLTSGCS
jgi:hypothetical protein